MYKAQRAKEAELFEFCEEVKKLKSEGQKAAVCFEEINEEVKPDEDCKMEVDSEAESRKKLHQREREVAKQLRKIEEFTDLDEGVTESHQDKWHQELLQSEQRRNDLLPEHEKMQEMSGAELADKMLLCKKNANKWTQKNEQIREIEKVQDDLKDSAIQKRSKRQSWRRKIEQKQAGEGRCGTDASQSNGRCMDPTCNIFSQLERTKPSSSWRSFNVTSIGGMECSIKRHQSQGACAKEQSQQGGA